MGNGDRLKKFGEKKTNSLPEPNDETFINGINRGTPEYHISRDQTILLYELRIIIALGGISLLTGALLRGSLYFDLFHR